MADDTQKIEQQIAQAREELAATLDQLADRANPQNLADEAKAKVVAFLNRPPVRIGLIAASGLAVVIVVRTIVKR